jgi:hypothetical protein
MKLIRPSTIDDAALLSSSIGEGGAVGLAGDEAPGDELLTGDFSGRLLYAGDEADALEWDAGTIYALSDQVLVTATNYHHGFESLSGGASSVVSMTIASPCVVTWTAHGLTANTPILFETTGALPTGLTAGTVYYVLAPMTDTFNVSATPGGAAINTTGSQSGVHTATANPNLNMDPRTHPEFWLDLGATNRWAMFDQYNTSQSSAPEQIEVEIAIAGRIDALALLNMSAATVHIVSESDTDGVIFDQTYNLVSTLGITNWYTYFFEDIVRTGDLVVDLPPYGGQTVTVTLTGNDETVRVGTLILGRKKELGATVYGASTGITDYSRKDTDDFGNFTIVKRAFSKRGSFKVWCDTNRVDDIQDTLSAFRAEPIVYIGSGDFANTQIFGFYKDFDAGNRRAVQILVHS